MEEGAKKESEDKVVMSYRENLQSELVGQPLEVWAAQIAQFFPHLHLQQHRSCDKTCDVHVPCA